MGARLIGLAGVAVCAVALWCSPARGAAAAGTDAATGPLPSRPNLILVLSDDQSMESVAKMPYLRSQVPPQGGWYRFPNAFINNATCCPSRATILTGLWSHHHGVETTGGAPPYDDSDTIATRLHAAGYRTGFVGKYHLSSPLTTGRTYIPPGWDTWQAYAYNTHDWYYNYTLNEQGTLVDYGSAPSDYSTDVLRDKALDFIDQNRDQAFFLIYAPRAPHNPWVAAPRHLGHYSAEPVEHAPNFNESDATDKPAWWRSLAPQDVAYMDGIRRMEWDTALALDDAVKAIDERVQGLGLTSKTVIVFMTDNGFAFGEHRYSGKVCQYEECSHTPLFVKFGDHNEGGTFSQMIGNEDLAPTFADLAGTSPPQPSDGQSFKSLLESATPPAEWNDVILIHGFQHGNNDGDQETPPTFWGLRTSRYKYVETVDTGEVELYDLTVDPYELDNLADRPDHADARARLSRALMELVVRGTRTLGSAWIDPTGSLQFAAGPGVRNDLAATGSDGSLILADEGAPVVAGAGCEQVGVARVRCPRAAVSRLVLHSGDENDAVVVSEGVDATVDGEADNDTLITNGGRDDLRGGGGNDVLDGGPGPDVLDGGDGVDTVTYAKRTADAPVYVDLDEGAGDDGGAEDGPRGARDSISATVENVTGGGGRDALTGNAGANRLVGGGGRDQLNALAGDDTIVGNADGSSDQVNCGAGASDILYADPFDVFPTTGPDACEILFIGSDATPTPPPPPPGGGGGEDTGGGTGSDTGGTTTQPATGPPAALPLPPAFPAPTRTAIRPSAIGLPAARHCVDRRRFSFKIHQPAGEAVVRVDVFVNGRKALSERGAKVNKLTLKRLPRRFVLRVEDTAADGDVLVTHRTYHVCRTSRSTQDL